MISVSFLMIWYIIFMCWFYATISTFYSEKIHLAAIVLRICLLSCLSISTIIIDLWSWIPGESSNPDEKIWQETQSQTGCFRYRDVLYKTDDGSTFVLRKIVVFFREILQNFSVFPGVQFEIKSRRFPYGDIFWTKRVRTSVSFVWYISQNELP